MGKFNDFMGISLQIVATVATGFLVVVWAIVSTLLWCSQLISNVLSRMESALQGSRLQMGKILGASKADVKVESSEACEASSSNPP